MPMRLIVPRMVRRQLTAQIKGHGMGRHSGSEIVALGTHSLNAAADFLGHKTYMMRYEPSGLDATAFAFLAGALCPTFETPLRTAVARHKNIKEYVGRMAKRFYPDFTEICKWVA